MIESRVFEFSAGGTPAIGSLRTIPQNETHRCSAFATLHLQHSNHIHGFSSQRTCARKLQIRCNPLKLGAAEEGVSSWEDKLESSSTERGELLEGDHMYTERKDGIVDEEGNIDNIELEQTRGPSEDEMGSARWPGEAGVKEGEKGEAVVDSVQVFPSVSPAQTQEHRKYGASESSCDEGSLAKKMSPNGSGKGNVTPKELYGAEQEDKLFQVDDGRALDDYQRRADLFDKNGEKLLARKHGTQR